MWCTTKLVDRLNESDLETSQFNLEPLAEDHDGMLDVFVESQNLMEEEEGFSIENWAAAAMASISETWEVNSFLRFDLSPQPTEVKNCCSLWTSSLSGHCGGKSCCLWGTDVL